MFPPLVPLEQSDIDERRASIRAHVLQHSRVIQQANFLRYYDGDLGLLFDHYDRLFFANTITDRLKRDRLNYPTLRFSGRLRSAGGRTTRTRHRDGTITYGIEIATHILADNFKDAAHRSVEVSGIACTDRLHALMFIFEHEMLHLYEFLFTSKSNCKAKPFRQLASHLFGHRASVHTMITAREKTWQSTTLRPRDRVEFTFEGQVLRGIINRINRRATVLVENPRGRKYTDGKRYVSYYVAIPHLRPA